MTVISLKIYFNPNSQENSNVKKILMLIVEKNNRQISGLNVLNEAVLMGAMTFVKNLYQNNRFLKNITVENVVTLDS